MYYLCIWIQKTYWPSCASLHFHLKYSFTILAAFICFDVASGYSIVWSSTIEIYRSIAKRDYTTNIGLILRLRCNLELIPTLNATFLSRVWNLSPIKFFLDVVVVVVCLKSLLFGFFSLNSCNLLRNNNNSKISKQFSLYFSLMQHKIVILRKLQHY